MRKRSGQKAAVMTTAPGPGATRLQTQELGDGLRPPLVPEMPAVGARKELLFLRSWAGSRPEIRGAFSVTLTQHSLL